MSADQTDVSTEKPWRTDLDAWTRRVKNIWAQPSETLQRLGADHYKANVEGIATSQILPIIDEVDLALEDLPLEDLATRSTVRGAMMGLSQAYNAPWNLPGVLGRYSNAIDLLSSKLAEQSAAKNTAPASKGDTAKDEDAGESAGEASKDEDTSESGAGQSGGKGAGANPKRDDTSFGRSFEARFRGAFK